jgi:hypothetical protein
LKEDDRDSIRAEVDEIIKKRGAQTSKSSVPAEMEGVVKDFGRKSVGGEIRGTKQKNSFRNIPIDKSIKKIPIPSNESKKFIDQGEYMKKVSETEKELKMRTGSNR